MTAYIVSFIEISTLTDESGTVASEVNNYYMEWQALKCETKLVRNRGKVKHSTSNNSF